MQTFQMFFNSKFQKIYHERWRYLPNSPKNYSKSKIKLVMEIQYQHSEVLSVLSVLHAKRILFNGLRGFNSTGYNINALNSETTKNTAVSIEIFVQ